MDNETFAEVKKVSCILHAFLSQCSYSKRERILYEVRGLAELADPNCTQKNNAKSHNPLTCSKL